MAARSPYGSETQPLDLDKAFATLQDLAELLQQKENEQLGRIEKSMEALSSKVAHLPAELCNLCREMAERSSKAAAVARFREKSPGSSLERMSQQQSASRSCAEDDFSEQDEPIPGEGTPAIRRETSSSRTGPTLKGKTPSEPGIDSSQLSLQFEEDTDVWRLKTEGRTFPRSLTHSSDRLQTVNEDERIHLVRRDYKAHATDLFVFRGGLKRDTMGPVQSIESQDMDEDRTDPLGLPRGRMKRRGSSITGSILDRLVSRPDSWFALTMDVLALVFLLYDSIMVPFQIAWSKPLTGFFFYGAVVTVTFWFLDMLRSFFTGFTKDLAVVMELREIARIYLRSWFIPDIIINFLDVAQIVVERVEVMAGSNTVLLRAARIFKIGRLIRIMKMLRTGRMAYLKELVLHYARLAGAASYVQVTLGGVRLLFTFVWFGHLGCCLWFLTVNSNDAPDTGQSWFNQLKQTYGDDIFDDDTFVYTYGLYWAVSTIFSSQSFLTPSNTAEAFLTLVIALFGSMFASMIVSAFAAMLIGFQESERAHSERMKVLQQFLRQHGAEAALSLSVQQHVQERTHEERHLADKDVEVLNLLPAALRRQLRHALYSTNVLFHPLFHTCDLLDGGLVRDICAEALQHTSVLPGQELFTASTPAECVWVLAYGAFQYTPTDEGAAIVDLTAGTWVCELALWTHWVTHGLLEATAGGEVLQFTVAGLEKVLLRFRLMRQVVRNYAATVCTVIEDMQPAELSDLSTGVDHDYVVAEMPRESGVLLSTPALQTLRESLGWPGVFQAKRKSIEDLEREVQIGACHIRREGSECLRVARVLALYLEKPQGVVLAELGAWKNSIPTPNVRLPGLKMVAEEGLQEALERLLEEDLTALLDGVRPPAKQVDVETETSNSAAYGVRTKYIRTIVKVDYDEEECEAKSYPVSEELLSGFASSGPTASRSTAPTPFAPEAQNLQLSLRPMSVFTIQSAAKGEHKYTLYAWLTSEDLNKLIKSPPEMKATVGRIMNELRPEKILAEPEYLSHGLGI